MGPYTALQLIEIAAFGFVAVFGLLAHHPSYAALGIGLLVSKAITNSLPPRHSVLYRSLIGYVTGLGLIGGTTVLLIRFVVR